MKKKSKKNEIDKAKTEFISLASHQLRSPLSAIRWYTEMLLAGDAGKLNKEQEKYLKEIYEGNNRMVKLVETLLSVSRLDLGGFPIEPAPTNIVKTAKTAINELSTMAKKKNLKISEKYATGLTKLTIDPRSIQIIFQNLLSNAIRYTPEKGKISIEVSLTKNKPSQLFIKISDTGLGIPETQKDKIFTKMFRADNARSHDSDGCGLGLYVVKSIAEHSRGKVWFESEENSGTTFFVQLPLLTIKHGNKGKNNTGC